MVSYPKSTHFVFEVAFLLLQLQNLVQTWIGNNLEDKILQYKGKTYILHVLEFCNLLRTYHAHYVFLI